MSGESAALSGMIDNLHQFRIETGLATSWEPEPVEPDFTGSMDVVSLDKRMVEGLPLFSGLVGPDFSHLLQFATIQRYPAGTLLFQQSERPDKLHIIISGTVELFARCSQREWGVMLMNAGDILMPAAVLFDEPYNTSARTLGSCRLLLIDAEKVKAEANRSPQFALRLSRAMAGQYRLAVRQLLDLKSRNAAQRLASLLLKIADQSGAPTPELPMRKRNLAARIGMTPETLSRTLQTLADNGLLVRGRQIIVKDRERIERFCGPGPYRPETEDALQVHAF
jgi:CRP/FNR family transcriptional activator FtrB